MNSSFALHFEWLAQEHGSPAEQAAFASLHMLIGQVNLTEVEDSAARTVRPSIRVGAGRLAEWLVANWWRLRWEPEGDSVDWRLSHNVAAVGGGYVWPNVCFSSDGQDILVIARPGEPWAGETVRYLSQVEASVPAADFEDTVDTFVEAVIERIRGCDVRNDSLGVAWQELLGERRDENAARERRLEALLGFDPYAAPDGLLERLGGFRSVFGSGAVEEVAAAAHAGAADLLASLRALGATDSTELTVPCLDDLRAGCAQARITAEPAWRQGARDAEHSRQIMGLGEGPIANAQLATLLDVPVAFLADQPVGASTLPVSAAFRNGSQNSLRVHLNRRPSTSRRFAVARLLADHIRAAPAESLLPATDARTFRQKYQRSFAQEFLCPFAPLQRLLGAGVPTGEDIDAASDHFHVSPLLVQTTLVNRGVLDRSTLRGY